MYDGEIVQIGTQVKLFEHPKHTSLGHFICSPDMNVMLIKVEGMRVKIGGQVTDLPGIPTAESSIVKIDIRPEYMQLGGQGNAGDNPQGLENLPPQGGER